jgi:hypothetical protein|tara:strand:+ start:7846 stop:8112 length:267 start_codon:yes stop_codon:yes gene_type:complete
MLKKSKENYIVLWEMVYNNPKELKGTPARLLVKIDKNNSVYKTGEVDQWVQEHRDQIAQCIIKAIKNKVSKYRCVKVFKVPFYSENRY